MKVIDQLKAMAVIQGHALISKNANTQYRCDRCQLGVGVNTYDSSLYIVGAAIRRCMQPASDIENDAPDRVRMVEWIYTCGGLEADVPCSL